jgi:hypothetical protein
MADRLHASLAHLITRFGAEDPPASLDDLSDGQIITHAAGALDGDAGWTGLDFPYPGFEAPSRNARAKPPRCSVVLAPREVAPTIDEPGLFSDATSTPEEACWVELVLAREWRQCERCPRYAAQFTDRAMRMVAQLATDERIVHARLVWIVLASSDERGRTDLASWEQLAVAEGLPIGAPVIRSTAMPDVQGNAACITAIVPVQRS